MVSKIFKSWEYKLRRRLKEDETKMMYTLHNIILPRRPKLPSLRSISFFSPRLLSLIWECEENLDFLKQTQFSELRHACRNLSLCAASA